MTLSLIALKSGALSLALCGIAVAGLASNSTARAGQDHGHADHGHAMEDSPHEQQFAGDPYLLSTDGVSGEGLGPVANQVIIQHEGRELRFASEKTAAAFRADPAKYLPGIDTKMIAQQLPYYPLETCVVSGEKLGGEMGDPIDVIYKNRLVRLCCKGCKKDLAKDPAGLIAKLDAAVIKEQSSTYPLQTCAISGEALGGMGETINYVIGNRLIKLCCKGCKKKVAKDPLAFLAKLDAAPADHGDHSSH